ncbi:hypothetical protein BDQ12DRAFT_681307 [Crucibulum laeve]|uniref:F-box domain-containing protein n=1 Tax=Crucibulum laeve TaxID=68775 RepID=A0A5C3M3P3_9AGAR|nr:hypothetical protein BDQ12DRAFT_681307 [Crucibulum laeve]
MHSAFLIDEVLRRIFDFCAEHSRSTLIAAARSCQAWKNPALDYIWVRLTSIAPLLDLIPNIVVEDGIYTLLRPALPSQMHTFHSYARRVKHISHRQCIRVNPMVLSLMIARNNLSTENAGILQDLRTVQMSSANCSDVQTSLGFSQKLSHLDLDLGFKTRGTSLDDTVCSYLEQVSTVSPELWHLSIRGRASPRLNNIVARLSNVHTLCLRMGDSLLPDTLKAAMQFPYLSELEMHASHFDVNELSEAFERSSNSATFSSLRKLRIRAHTSIMELVLQQMQSTTLESIHLEADDATPASAEWETIFTSVCEKSRNTLHELKVEHHSEDTDIPSDNSGTTNTSQTSYTTDTDPTTTKNAMSFKVLRTLNKLTCLRRLSFDMTLPPTVCDQDIESLVYWWPELEHLDLGIPTPEDEDESPSPQPPSNITLASLSLFSQKLPMLRSLALPIDIEGTPHGPYLPSQSGLERLTLGSHATPNPAALAAYLHLIFPKLHTIDGPHDQETIYIDTQDALVRLHTPS